MQQNDALADHHINPLYNHHLVINTFYLQSHHVYSGCRSVQIMVWLKKLQNQGVPIVQANLQIIQGSKISHVIGFRITK